MKKIIILILAVVLLTACGSKNQKKEKNESGPVQSITCAKMRNMVDEGEAVLIDVRTKEEYEEQHLTKAINIPNETIKDIQNDSSIEKETNIIVYCRSGARSKNSASKLVKMGYKNVYDLGAISNCQK